MASLEEIKKTVQEQNEELERIASSPLLIGTVVGIEDKFVFLTMGGATVRIMRPAKIKFGVNDSVLVHPKTQQIVDVCPPKYAEQSSERFKPDAIPDVTWNDIGGLGEAKQQMIEAVELPITNKEVFAFYGKKPTKGILLYGAPGCGKTMLGKAAANAIAKLYKAKAGAFLYVKAPEILNKFVGESEATVRGLFDSAREHKKKHGYPLTIFIDEADAILGKRGNGRSMNATIVPMFLAEMDGMEDSGALIILATNRPDALDPAIVRDGRIDRKIKITRPTEESAVEIMEALLSKVPCDDPNGIAQTAAKEIYSNKHVLYDVQTKKGTVHLTLRDIVNGAMLAGIVEYSLSLAIRRDMRDGKKTGVSEIDVLASVKNTYEQSVDVDHTAEIDEFTMPFQSEVIDVRKAA